MKTLMIITPHMSTGGCPQFVSKKVELLKDFYNVVVVEYDMGISGPAKEIPTTFAVPVTV